MIITNLDRAACMALLEANRGGRLACAKDGQPYIVPVTFTKDGGYLYGFSLEGQKIDWMRANPKVCVQVEEYAGKDEWKSVIVYGAFEELPDEIGHKIQREKAWSLLSKHAEWWAPGGQKPAGETPRPHLFYRIRIDEVTGRQALPGN